MFIFIYRIVFLKDVFIRLSNGIFSRVVIFFFMEVFMLNLKRFIIYFDKM